MTLSVNGSRSIFHGRKCFYCFQPHVSLRGLQGFITAVYYNHATLHEIETIITFSTVIWYLFLKNLRGSTLIETEARKNAPAMSTFSF